MAPALLESMESFARQWDKVHSVTVELRKAGEQTIASITIDVEKGQQLRIVNWPMPTLPSRPR